MRGAIATLLVSAAFLKTQAVHDGLSVSSWLVAGELALVLMELFVSAWVVLTLSRIPLIGAAMLFGTFAVISVAKGVMGAKSCGCFGAVAVNPWIIAAVDLCVVVAALLAVATKCECRGLAMAEDFVGGLPRSLFVASLVGLPLVAWGLGGYRNNVGGWIEIANVRGLQFPLADSMRLPGGGPEGAWVVLLARSNCPDCAVEKTRLSVDVARISLGQKAKAAVVFMTKADYDADAASVQPGVLAGYIADGGNVRVETPMVVHLQNGVVIAGAQGKEVVTRAL